jgi:hypothetical protein
MKKSFFLCLLSLLSFDCSAKKRDNFPQKDCSSAILCKPNNGRFGDQLVCYSKGKWLSYKFNIPLFYIPFNYSDQLMLHEHETIYTQKTDRLFSKITELPIQFTGELIPDSNTLYTCYWKIDAGIDWDDTLFLEQLRNNICPRHTLNKIIAPEGYISIAAHVRNGGGFYFDYSEKRDDNPLRFVPEEFFIEQIARLAEIFPEQKLYVHIFTDHKKPSVLKKKFANALANPRIKFGYRKKNNSHDSNVLEDFFSMMDFHCLIRPASNFTKIVQFIGNNKVVIYPSSSYKNDQGKSVINSIVIKTRDQFGDIWRTEKVSIA